MNVLIALTTPLSDCGTQVSFSFLVWMKSVWKIFPRPVARLIAGFEYASVLFKLDGERKDNGVKTMIVKIIGGG